MCLLVWQKMVNKSQLNDEDVTPEFAELVTQMLSRGMSKEACDELMENFPTPSNCNRLEVVRVNPKYLAALGKN